MISARSRFEFDDAHPDVAVAFLQLVRHVASDVAAAADQHPPRRSLFVAEQAEHARRLAALGDDEHLIARLHLVAPVRHHELALAHHAHHHRVEVGKELGELFQWRVDDGTVVAQRDAHGHDALLGEIDGIERSRQFQPPQHHFAHRQFGRDDHVDGSVVGRKQIAVFRLQIGLVAHPRDAGGDGEDGVRHLAGHHVHLVGEGNGDDHVGFARACPLQDVGMGAVADDPLHVETVGERLHQLRRDVDHGDVVAFPGQALGDAAADLACPADNDFHGRPTPRSVLGGFTLINRLRLRRGVMRWRSPTA